MQSRHAPTVTTTRRWRSAMAVCCASVWCWGAVACAQSRLPPVDTPAKLLPTAFAAALFQERPLAESARPATAVQASAQVPVGILPHAAANPASVTPAPLEERLQAIEQRNAQLEARVSEVLQQNEQLSQQLSEMTGGDGPENRRLARSFDDQPEDIRGDQPEPTVGETWTQSSFGEGFKWETRDGEYALVFHNETQLDTRAYGQPNSEPVDQFGFYINRLRAYFNGHVTKPIEYSISFNKGLGNLDLLDAYFNFNYDPRFQVRFGRYRVPFTYDWYELSNQFLTTPERSVFAINYGYNRNFALMLHGEILEDSAEYAVAVANGPRNSYFDENAQKDLLAFINYRPFENADNLTELKNLNLGGSLGYGYQDQTPKPEQFRTSLNATDSAGADRAAPVFLELEGDVLERGLRRLWELHAAYYYKQLTLQVAWDTGFNSYSHGQDGPVRVPTYGYHAQFAYLVTGEEIDRRTFIQPLQPFDLRNGQRGHGAIELQARYDDFRVGNEIFTSGFADPNLWTNRVQTIDAGVNWYLNMFVRIQFDWQHAIFAHPVPYRPGAFQSSSDLFWLRTQLYF